MTSAQPDRNAIGDVLDRLENSVTFRTADRQRRLVRYLLERASRSPGPGTKEYVIGLEVFGRPPSFDPALDSIVRVEMRKLRRNLERYYETEGRRDRIRVSIPKGSYAAVLEPQAAPVPAAEFPPRRRTHLRRSWITALAVLVVLGAILTGIAAWKSGAPHPRNRHGGAIAVLPFANLGGSVAGQAVADGLTAELIDRFGKMPGTRVASRGAVLQFRGGAADRTRIRSELGVETVLEGSVRIGGNHARIGAELVDAESGRVLLSKTYDIEMRDPGTAETEAAEAILSTLNFQAPNMDEKELAVRYSGSPDARELYLHGMYGFERVSRAGLEQSIVAFQQATELDPGYAPAYSAAADAYVAMTIYGHLPARDAVPRARAAAQTALRLDPTLGDPHAVLGFALAVYDWNWPDARHEFQKAIELNPGCAHCRAWYAFYVLGPSGDEAEGLSQVEKTIELDPIDDTFQGFRVAVPYYASDYAKAVQAGEQAVASDPNSGIARMYFGAALRKAGRIAEAIEQDRKAVELFRGNPIALRNMGEAYASAGRRSEAAAILQELERRAQHEHVSAVVLADLHAVLGHRAQALDCLRRAVADRDVYLMFLRTAAIYETMHADRDFQAIWRDVDPSARRT